MQPTEPSIGTERPAPPSLEAVRAAFPQLAILDFLGQGGMGWVFKARQPKLNRLSKEGKWGEMAELLSEDVMDAFVVSGTAEQVVDQLKTIFGGKIDRTSFGFALKDPDRLKALIQRMKAA